MWWGGGEKLYYIFLSKYLVNGKLFLIRASLGQGKGMIQSRTKCQDISGFRSVQKSSLEVRSMLCPCLVLTDELPIWRDTVLQAVQFPAGEANLTASLAEVDGDTFPGHLGPVPVSRGRFSRQTSVILWI